VSVAIKLLSELNYLEIKIYVKKIIEQFSSIMERLINNYLFRHCNLITLSKKPDRV
jgi:hypothetical protein